MTIDLIAESGRCGGGAGWGAGAASSWRGTLTAVCTVHCSRRQPGMSCWPGEVWRLTEHLAISGRNNRCVMCVTIWSPNWRTLAHSAAAAVLSAARLRRMQI